MKTYKILILTLLLGLGNTVSLNAQNKLENEVSQKEQSLSVKQMEKLQCDYIANQLKLDEDLTAKFTTLYQDYLQDVQKCALKYQKIPEKTGKYSEIDKKTVGAQVMGTLSKNRELLEIQENYYYKFREFLSAKEIQKIYMM